MRLHSGLAGRAGLAPVLTTLLASSLLGACGGATLPAAAPGEKPPIVLVGLDGFEWRVVREMLARGELPNIARLMKDGVFGELSTLRPTLSPAIWTTIATGHSPEQHGIAGFVTVGRGNKTRLNNSRDRRTAALWNILSRYRHSVAVVGWWLSYPVEEVEGVMVAQVNTVTNELRRLGRGISKGSLVSGLEDQVYPRSLQDELLALIPEVTAGLDQDLRELLGEIPDLPGSPGSLLLEHCRWAFRADRIYQRVALKLLEANPLPDFFAVYFGGADVVGHRFWRYSYPGLYRNKPAALETAAFGPLVQKYYAYLDRNVGELIGALDKDAIVMLVGDHGMRPIRRRGAFNPEKGMPALNSGGHQAAPNAFFVAAGPAIRKRNEDPGPPGSPATDPRLLGSVADITPTILALRGLPVGSDMEGKVMEGIIERAFLESAPIRYVATHSGSRWWLSRLWRRDGGAAAERIEQLRSLGYIQ